MVMILFWYLVAIYFIYFSTYYSASFRPKNGDNILLKHADENGLGTNKV